LGSSNYSVNPLKDNHRDLARRLPLVLGEKRHQCLLSVEEELALLPLGKRRSHRKILRSDLDDCFGVRDEVVIPIGVGRGAAFGGNHDDAIADGALVEWCNAGSPDMAPVVVNALANGATHPSVPGQ
jgi:hypothetical protein